MPVDKELLRKLPKVDDALKAAEARGLYARFPRRYIVETLREAIERRRSSLLMGHTVDISLEAVLPEAELELTRICAPSLRPIINATGIVMHTNLGRSGLSQDAINNIMAVARGYSNLEYELDRAARGERYSHITRLLKETTGAEDGIAVNNNAAAVIVCLAALATGREVIVSRGELVEIGGSFRIPEVMAQSGAILKEVGSTNKTHLRDYERAISENTSLILKVHQSNYRITGFTSEVSIEELCALGRKTGVPVMHDLGSGCLIDLASHGIHGEPSVRQVVQAGPDIVTFSGDKLLGGPQAGLIVGSRRFIDGIRRHPLLRALRIDKLTLAALEATLRAYIDEQAALRDIPTLRMLLEPAASVAARARKLARLIKGVAATVNVVADATYSGGGALPMQQIPSWAVSVVPLNISVNTLETKLRTEPPHIIAHIRDASLLLNLRSVSEHEVAPIASKLKETLK